MKKRNIPALLAALVPTVGAASLISTAVAYRAIFPRYERPNYALVPGEYLYSRIADRLPRREMYFKPHTHTLKGYFYGRTTSRGVVILRHGIHSGSDDYLPLTEALVRRGYGVFTYDGTGTFESEGKSTVGMCQAIIDLEASLKYLLRKGEISGAPIYLLGHSLGAYAVTAALCTLDGISAVAAIAGMNSGIDIIADRVREYIRVRGFVELQQGILLAYQRYLFGHYVDMTAVSGIMRANVPTLLAHGVDDKVIRLSRQSITAHTEPISAPNIEYYLGRGLVGGHNSIWHSPAAVSYKMQLESDLKLLKMASGGKASSAARAKLYSGIDHKKFSEVNEELVDRIDATFRSAR